LVNRTLATLRRAEFGFLGVVVYTRVHTPRLCGQLSRALDLLFARMISLPFLTNCCIVGIRNLFEIWDGKGNRQAGNLQINVHLRLSQASHVYQLFSLPGFQSGFFLPHVPYERWKRPGAWCNPYTGAP